MNSEKIYQQELEALCGKVFVGDMTPIVYELLKTTHHKDSLLAYLTGVRRSNVDNNNTNKSVRTQSDNRPSFAEWFRHCERL